MCVCASLFRFLVLGFVTTGHYTRQVRYLDENKPVNIVHFEKLQEEFQVWK